MDDKLSDIFPSSWCLLYHLFIEFCRRTKTHLQQQLTLLEQKNLETTAYVQIVIKALKATLVFETEIKAKVISLIMYFYSHYIHMSNYICYPSFFFKNKS